MRVFVTGATGFIGSLVVKELIAKGHQVLGLCRSEDKARMLEAAGAEIHRGSLENLDSLRAGAKRADTVIHTAFDHDFSRFAANCEKDRQAIRALGSALAGSDRLLLITSGTGMGDPGDGQLAREDIYNLDHPNPRSASEQAGQELLEAGVAVSVVRLPQVHDVARQGLITPCIATAREKGYCAYVGEGHNRWPAAHVQDVARLYRLAAERGAAGERYHAVAEEGVAMRDIMQVIGAGLSVPVRSITTDEAAAYFGWLAPFASMDLAASGDWTRETLNWHPNGPSLVEDLERAFVPVQA